MGCTVTAMGYVGTLVTGPSLRRPRQARQGTYAGWVTPRSLPGPLLGLVTLLLAISVVAMHQLGPGHQPPPSGEGHHATVSVGPHAGADKALAQEIITAQNKEIGAMAQLPSTITG